MASSAPYNIYLLNDLHYHFPDLLYRAERFQSVQDVLQYIVHVAATSPYQRMREAHLRQNSPSAPLLNPFTAPSVPSAPSSNPVSVQSVTIPLNEIYPLFTSATSSAAATVSDGLMSSLFSRRQWQAAPSSVSSGNMSTMLSMLLNTMRDQEDDSTRAPTPEELQLRTVVYRISSPYESKEEHDNRAYQDDGKREEKEPDVCAICQDPFEEQQYARKISRCTHVFHKTCLDVWFQNHTTCPTCRYDIRTPHAGHSAEEDDNEDDEDEDEDEDEEPVIMVNIQTHRTNH